MFKAMVSFGGVPSLNVTLCEPFTSVETPAFKIDNVSLLSNIEYSAEGIRVFWPNLLELIMTCPQ